MARSKSIFFLALFSLALVSAVASAEVYRYTDESGKTHYVTNAEVIPERYRGQAKVPHELPKINRSASVLQKGAPASPDRVIYPTSKPRNAGGVQIFVTSWCPYCKALESFLKRNKVTYKRWDVERSKEGKKKYQQLGAGGVPIVQVGSQVLRGFDEAELSQVLNLK